MASSASEGPGEPIRFYFDFASPYAFIASRQIDAIAAKGRLAVEWRPVILWAVLKAQGIPSPMESPVRRAYFLRDMARSAHFHGVAYREPVRLPLSSHLAARLWHNVADRDRDRARPLAEGLFRAFFQDGRDIGDEDVLVAVAAEIGLAADEAQEAMKGDLGRTRLRETVEAAIADGVVGSPFFTLGTDGFFGVDRLPQLARALEEGAR